MKESHDEKLMYEEKNEKLILVEMQRIYRLACLGLMSLVDNPEGEVLKKIEFNSFRYPASALKKGNFDTVMARLKKRSKKLNLKAQFYGIQ